MTRAEAVEQLRTLGTVAVRDLAVPAVIRPRRDGWLIFMRGGAVHREPSCRPPCTCTARYPGAA